MSEAEKMLFKERIEPKPDEYDGCEFCEDIEFLDDVTHSPCIAKYKDNASNFPVTRYGIVIDETMWLYNIRYCPMCGTRLRRGRR